MRKGRDLREVHASVYTERRSEGHTLYMTDC